MGPRSRSQVHPNCVTTAHPAGAEADGVVQAAPPRAPDTNTGHGVATTTSICTSYPTRRLQLRPNLVYVPFGADPDGSKLAGMLAE
jgi:hypothetical protein